MQTTIAAPARSIPAAAGATAKAATRMFFVDNIRVLLTVLVLLHHLMITYAGSGGWYYKEGLQDFPTTAFGAWFCATDQAFFMGLFLLISAYFVPGSYDRKGAWQFFKDRLIRLGIPLAIYSWVLNPILIYVFLGGGSGRSFWDYYTRVYFSRGELLGQGPTWFIETLLIFSLVYVGWRAIRRHEPATAPAPAKEYPFPSNRTIALFALLLAVLAFLVRLVFIVDEYNFAPLNLQLAYFAQYIALFVVGLVAYRRNWLMALPDATGRLWLRVAVFCALVWWPFVLASGAADDIMPFKGGLHWQSFATAAWESFTCVAISISLIYLFRRYLNRQGSVATFLSRNAYTAYLIHPLVLVPVALALQSVMLYPLLKWVVVGMVVVPLCFALGQLIRKLPYTERVL